jgi:hypothetical protein
MAVKSIDPKELEAQCCSSENAPLARHCAKASVIHEHRTAKGAGPLSGCPSGFVCRDNLVLDLGLSESAAYLGGYCVVAN